MPKQDKMYCLSLGGVPILISKKVSKMHEHALIVSDNVASYETVARNVRKEDLYSVVTEQNTLIIITTVKEI